MLKCIVIDDNDIAREYFVELLRLTGMIVVVGDYGEPYKGILMVNQLSPDAVFLDIQMEPLSGLEVAKALIAKNNPPEIVFITGYPEYAQQAYEINAVDYVMKPYDFPRIITSVNRIIDRLQPRNRKVIFKNGSATYYVEPSDIIFIETLNKRSIVHCFDGKLTINETLTSIERRLLGFGDFVRSHRSFLVNRSWIKAISKDTKNTYKIYFKNYSGTADLSFDNVQHFL
ncbi:hypothetical protein DCCM_4606 [Desulfocucumis palustris]|uniref:Stage 0 sporulation protein A homolog n=1 Tax=Desulfocucumis palustris TaxID=1898651 RepID=A0A2L2XGI5_9FIRM|nr:LytTR family DNA-binding domain-containing protein [Desulfocucumis palustris]GBF35477.1 hypothetical protein DCCM_4606 [Desulfocucumis palustris]